MPRLPNPQCSALRKVQQPHKDHFETAQTALQRHSTLKPDNSLDAEATDVEHQHWATITPTLRHTDIVLPYPCF